MVSSHLAIPPKIDMHPSPSRQYLSGVPWPLWWQAAQERKSRRRVRAPATVPGASAVSSPLSHHHPPQQTSNSQRASSTMSLSLQALSFLPSRCPFLPVQLMFSLSRPGFFQKASSPLPSDLANCHLTYFLKPQPTDHCPHKTR